MGRKGRNLTYPLTGQWIFKNNSSLMNINEKSIARCSLVGIFNKVLERSDLRMTYLLTDKYIMLK